MYLALHFQRTQSLQHEIKSHSKAEGSTFFDTMRLSSFFRHCETVQISDFFPKFFLLFHPSIFDTLQQNGCSKNPKGSPLLHFSALCDLPETSKKISEKILDFFFSIFSFSRAFVVFRCRKSGFRGFLSLRYGADLGRSRLV